MPRLLPSLLLAAALALAACGGDDEEPPRATTTSGGTQETGGRREVATGLQVPWGIAFRPGGDALVAERTSGRVLRVQPGGGPPEVVRQLDDVDTGAGEGGLLGLAVSPDDDTMVYAYYTTAEDNRIVRFSLRGGDVEPVLTGLERSAIHNGGRIAFGPDGMLYAGVGDAGTPALAQDRDALNGKILRLTPDGDVPDDNPFGTAVWSWGHRNVQGLAWDADGRLWATEFGQNTTDEVNLIEQGANYGWPEVEGEGDTQGGRFTNPKVTWDTSEASPSGAAIAGGALYVAALRGERLWRVPLDGTEAGEPEALFDRELGRLRTVVATPEGDELWVATSNTDGRGDPRDGDDRIVAVPLRP